MNVFIMCVFILTNCHLERCVVVATFKTHDGCLSAQAKYVRDHVDQKPDIGSLSCASYWVAP